MRIHHKRPVRLCLLFHLLPLCFAERIAVIGGGISGTFLTKYLIDYDEDCSLEELTIFDPLPLGQMLTKESPNDPNWQGNRVGTYQLDDGRIVELGASIMTDSFSFILEMVHAGNLTVGRPFSTGVPDKKLGTGMVISNGNGDNVLNTANMTSFETKLALMLRYNVDLWKVSRAITNSIDRFHGLQEHLREDERFFYNSPKEMWEAVNLQELVNMSLARFCDRIGVPNHVPWWRYYLYGQGSLREELLSSVNLVNYNQDASQINALSGLASLSASMVPLYSITGGNVQIVRSAFQQAQKKRQENCPSQVISHEAKRISTVIGSLDGFELYANDGSVVGEYDIVILATPVSMARVEFLIKSHIDESVLQPMPLGGLVENKEDTKISQDHEGHPPLPTKLPKSVTRPYTQVVTTLVKNAKLQIDYFQIDQEHVPRGIYMTPKGKAAEYNVTAIAQIASKDGLYKVFSSQPLGHDTLRLFFGPSVEIEFEKHWGGPYGGATPDYQGQGETTGFLLFDGAMGFHGHTTSGALYYTSALEHTFANIELSAMGARAVAKLIAKRLGWVTPTKEDHMMGEEL